MLDYLSLLHRYIPPTAPEYRLYGIHVTLVTNKALAKARDLQLNPDQLAFIEEASMLHDIGICRVNIPELGAGREKPYMAHGFVGYQILLEERLPDHARVALTHSGTGLLAPDVQKLQLPGPIENRIPLTVEEELISWADLFFTKQPELVWQEKTWEQVQQKVGQYSDWHRQRLSYFAEKFG